MATNPRAFLDSMIVLGAMSAALMIAFASLAVFAPSPALAPEPPPRPVAAVPYCHSRQLGRIGNAGLFVPCRFVKWEGRA